MSPQEDAFGHRVLNIELSGHRQQPHALRRRLVTPFLVAALSVSGIDADEAVDPSNFIRQTADGALASLRLVEFVRLGVPAHKR